MLRKFLIYMNEGNRIGWTANRDDEVQWCTDIDDLKMKGIENLNIPEDKHEWFKSQVDKALLDIDEFNYSIAKFTETGEYNCLFDDPKFITNPRQLFWFYEEGKGTRWD